MRALFYTRICYNNLGLYVLERLGTQMVKKDFYYPSADGQTRIHAITWAPEGKPKGIVQIIHGMVEFIDRYDEFARFLVERDFLVCGEDHLGHGESVISDEYHGYFGKDGNAWLISDIHQLRTIMQEEYPDLQYLMIGHSMGSFLLRQYITEKDAEYAKGLSGVLLLGTGWLPAVKIRGGMMLAKIMGTSKIGKRAKMIDVGSFGTYLKRINNPRTMNDWLTKERDVVDWYRSTPWCTFHFTPNAYYHMFSGMLKAHDTHRMKKLPEGLPILIASGAEDPVGGWGEGVRKTYMAYIENSPCRVDIRLYEDDRHEILNESDKKDVFEDLGAFLDYCLQEDQEINDAPPTDN